MPSNDNLRVVPEVDAPRRRQRHQTATGVARAAATTAAQEVIKHATKRPWPPWVVAVIVSTAMVCLTVLGVITWSRLAPNEAEVLPLPAKTSDTRVECDPLLVAWIMQTMIWAKTEERAALSRGDTEAAARWATRHDVSEFPIDVQNCVSWYKRVGISP